MSSKGGRLVESWCMPEWKSIRLLQKGPKKATGTLSLSFMRLSWTFCRNHPISPTCCRKMETIVAPSQSFSAFSMILSLSPLIIARPPIQSFQIGFFSRSGRQRKHSSESAQRMLNLSLPLSLRMYVLMAGLTTSILLWQMQRRWRQGGDYLRYPEPKFQWKVSEWLSCCQPTSQSYAIQVILYERGKFRCFSMILLIFQLFNFDKRIARVHQGISGFRASLFRNRHIYCCWWALPPPSLTKTAQKPKTSWRPIIFSHSYLGKDRRDSPAEELLYNSCYQNPPSFRLRTHFAPDSSSYTGHSPPSIFFATCCTIQNHRMTELGNSFCLQPKRNRPNRLRPTQHFLKNKQTPADEWQRGGGENRTFLSYKGRAEQSNRLRLRHYQMGRAWSYLRLFGDNQGRELATLKKQSLRRQIEYARRYHYWPHAGSQPMRGLGQTDQGRIHLLLAEVLDCALQVGPEAVHALLGQQLALLPQQQSQHLHPQVQLPDLPAHHAVDHAPDDVVLLQHRPALPQPPPRQPCPTLLDLPQKGRADLPQQLYLGVYFGFRREEGNQAGGVGELAVGLVGVQVPGIDEEGVDVEFQVGLHPLALLPPHQLQQLAVDLRPLPETLQHLVRTVLVEVGEGVDLLLVEHRQGVLEVVVGDVGHEAALLVVEVDDLQGGGELEQQDGPRPDRVHRVQQGVLPPLLLDLGVDLGQLPVLQGLRQVLQQRETLLDLRPQLRKFGLEVVPHLGLQVEHVGGVDAAEGVLDVVDQSVRPQPLLNCRLQVQRAVQVPQRREPAVPLLLPLHVDALTQRVALLTPDVLDASTDLRPALLHRIPIILTGEASDKQEGAVHRNWRKRDRAVWRPPVEMENMNGLRNLTTQNKKNDNIPDGDPPNCPKNPPLKLCGAPLTNIAEMRCLVTNIFCGDVPALLLQAEVREVHLQLAHLGFLRDPRRPLGGLALLPLALQLRLHRLHPPRTRSHPQNRRGRVNPLIHLSTAMMNDIS